MKQLPSQITDRLYIESPNSFDRAKEKAWVKVKIRIKKIADKKVQISLASVKVYKAFWANLILSIKEKL